jgi:hypothetical protein
MPFARIKSALGDTLTPPHRVTVKQGIFHHQARCTCGWRGDVTAESFAIVDAEAHEVVHIADEVCAAASAEAAERVARYAIRALTPSGLTHAEWLAEARRRYEGTNPGTFNEQAGAPPVETLLERAMRDGGAI